jgi:hypothetical protein
MTYSQVDFTLFCIIRQEKRAGGGISEEAATFFTQILQSGKTGIILALYTS